MSQPPGLFDIGKLAMAVSWASGPVKAGGRAVEVQMSTGTKGGNAVESFFVASFSRSERGRGFKQRATDAAADRGPHIVAASSNDFTRKPKRGIRQKPA